MGVYPDEVSHSLYPKDALQAAMDRWGRQRLTPDMRLAVGIDVARDSDACVLCFTQGDTILEWVEVPTAHDMTVTHDAIEGLLYDRGYMRRGSVGPYSSSAAGKLCIDASGLGAATYDHFRAIGFNVGKPFLGGATAFDSTQFANVRSEAFFQLRALLLDRLAIPHSPQFLEECAATSWSITARSTKLIQGKDSIRKALGGRSTDFLDSASMALYAPRGTRASVGGVLVDL